MKDFKEECIQLSRCLLPRNVVDAVGIKYCNGSAWVHLKMLCMGDPIIGLCYDLTKIQIYQGKKN